MAWTLRVPTARSSGWCASAAGFQRCRRKRSNSSISEQLSFCSTAFVFIFLRYPPFPRIGLAVILRTRCGPGFARPQNYGIAKKLIQAEIPIAIVFGNDTFSMTVAPRREAMKQNHEDEDYVCWPFHKSQRERVRRNSIVIQCRNSPIKRRCQAIDAEG